MIVSNIKNYTNGWMVGDFSPSLIRSPQFEFAHHTHLAGAKTNPHFHKSSTEINYIISGELIVSGWRLSAGDVWIYEKNEVSDVEFLTDVSLIIVRYPSIPGDKHECIRTAVF